MAQMVSSLTPNLLTFLLGEPDRHAFENILGEEPAWFSPGLTCIVSAKSRGMESLTFAMLKHLTKAFASGLRKSGFAPGDRLLAITPETTDLPVILLGTIAAGGIFLCQRPGLSLEALAATFRSYEPSFVVVSKGHERLAKLASRIADIEARLYVHEDKFSNELQSLNGLPHWGRLLDRGGADAFRWTTFKTSEDAHFSALITFTSG